MHFNSHFWLKFSLFNLFLVSILGLLMRYKIGFDFPYLSQKNIQHAHSHFAFLGWITHCLYTLLSHYIHKHSRQTVSTKYSTIIWLNLLCSYALLFSFFFTGYSIFSIILSTLSITLACWFTYCFFKDSEHLQGTKLALRWFKAGLGFHLLSTFGTFYLAYIMASHRFDEHLYLASVYFYLNFQYNGFFTFVCFGLAFELLYSRFPTFTDKHHVFQLLFWSCIPAYFLSTLWTKLPTWIYWFAVSAAFLQVYAWLRFLFQIKNTLLFSAKKWSLYSTLFVFVGTAYSIKILLQLGSTVPEISHLAFGFRPVVIAYLHLVLLAFVSVFILAYAGYNRLIQFKKENPLPLLVFTSGVLLNELALGIHGVASISYLPLLHIHYYLLIIAVLIFLATVWLFSASKKITE